MKKIIIETNYPVAFDSHDHLHPGGTKHDNNTSEEFINDLEQTYGKSMYFMDLGCAGGLLVHDLIKRGHIAVGLEGSDYNVKNPRAEWPALYQKNLFTCDVSRDYTVFIEEFGEKKIFSCNAITAWEVIEHIPPDRLKVFFENIRKHLQIGGCFYGSISVVSDFNNYHKSVFSKPFWEHKILNQLEGLKNKNYPYPVQQVVRKDVVGSTSFMIALERHS